MKWLNESTWGAKRVWRRSRAAPGVAFEVTFRKGGVSDDRPLCATSPRAIKLFPHDVPPTYHAKRATHFVSRRPSLIPTRPSSRPRGGDLRASFRSCGKSYSGG